MEKKTFDWNHFASMATIIAVILVFPIYLGNKIDSKIDALQNKLESKMDAYVQQSRQEMNEFRSEMQHFHGKQCSFEVEIHQMKQEIAKK